MFASIRRNLWNLRLYYFLMAGGGGFLLPYHQSLLHTARPDRNRDWAAGDTGAGAALIAAPFWGWRRDAAHPARLMQFGRLASAICMAVIVTTEALLAAGGTALARLVMRLMTRKQQPAMVELPAK
jgi:hypothetical protein